MAKTTEHPPLKIDVWDGKEWRHFFVVPPEDSFKPKCGNNIHQFGPLWVRCACGHMLREDK